MAAKFILPALALAGKTLAQTSQCSGPLKISSSSDTSVLTACHTWEGDIELDSALQGQISMDYLQTINGDLVCHNATNLASISAPQLGSIGGSFDLNGLTILSTLSFGRLTRVNKINWVALPALQQLSFPMGVSEANQVYISNTGLTTLSGIELTQVGNMDINNNQFLKTINVNSLTNVTQFLSFSANGMDLAIDFPNLEGAANLTFRNVSSISVPSLSSVGGAMGFYSNYFDTFSAPNLTDTGNTIAFVDNPDLTNISMPSLTHIGGGLQLANNSKLDAVDGFTKLKTIDGDISFAGTFSTVEFNSLVLVRGGATVLTSSTSNQVCQKFDSASQNQIIRGVENCTNNVSAPETNGKGGSTTSGSWAAPAPGWDPSAPLTGVAAFIAALLFL